MISHCLKVTTAITYNNSAHVVWFDLRSCRTSTKKGTTSSQRTANRLETDCKWTTNRLDNYIRFYLYSFHNENRLCKIPKTFSLDFQNVLISVQNVIY
jgi:hypothetical protein